MKPSYLFWVISMSIAFFFLCCMSSNLIDEYKTDRPFYCGNPSVIADYERQRLIPPLNPTESAIVKLKLKQVQVFTRSGSRTVSQDRKCWKDFKPQHDCQSGKVTTEATAENSGVAMRFYDITKEDFNKPADSSCKLGKLLPDGHEQNRLNGMILANAYFTDPTPANNLFDLRGKLTETSNVALHDLIRFRSADSYRSRESGVEVLASMVKAVSPTLTKAILPYDPDVEESYTLLPNTDECRALVKATDQAFASEDYTQKFGKKNEKARELAKQLMGVELNPKASAGSWPWESLDCLGVALCSSSDLPTGENWTRENVDLMYAAAIEESGWRFLANNARYSKIASARFAYDVEAHAAWALCGVQGIFDTRPGSCMNTLFDGFDAAFNMSSYLLHDSKYYDTPFVYRSAHETTIGPFLAAFGEKFWNDISADYIKKNSKFDGLKSPYPAYATLMVLEFYQSGAQYLFRMIYNGQVITHHVPGCTQDKELCYVTLLFKAMAWATRRFALDPCKLLQVVSVKKPSNSFVLAPSLFTTLIGFGLSQMYT